MIAEQAGDAAMTVWALTALLVAVGRQGRYGEALAHARRAAALAAGSRDTRSLPLQPKFFLGLALADCDLIDEARAAFRAALEDEFGSAWWLSDTLMADAQAAFVIGEWADALPGLVAGSHAAEEKGHQLLVCAVARLPDHHRDREGRPAGRGGAGRADRGVTAGRPAGLQRRASWRSPWPG